MSIGSLGGAQQNPMLLSLLSRLSPTQSATATTTNSITPDTSVPASATGTSDTSLTGSTKAQLSGQILGLLTMMQASASSPAGNQPSASASTSTSQDPLANLISSIDSDGDGSVSQSELESYIENLGGTQDQADSLFSSLNTSGSANLTKDQLSSDLQSAQAARPHGHHHHHQGGGQVPSADKVGSQLVQAMDSSGDNSVDQSEFENFVTSIGGTANEADSDFAALGGNSGSPITADQFASAIKAFETSSQTIAAGSNPILTVLDNLGTGTKPATSTTA